jgi:hypothetical protein
MNDLLMSEEEKVRFFMGDDAFERADLERRIKELERQLDDKDRMMKITLQKAEADYQKKISDIKQQRVAAIEQLGMVYSHYTDPEKLSKQDKDALICGLQIALTNTKLMIQLVHDYYNGGRGHTTEFNNLICAIKAWANIDASSLPGVSLSEDEKRAYTSNLKDLVYEHIRAIFQPHKTYTGAWTKDADPSMHPFGVFVNAQDDSATDDSATDEDTLDDDTTIVYSPSGGLLVLPGKEAP